MMSSEIIVLATVFGGVSSISKSQMLKVSGFSLLYFGWGGEDDDFARRIYHSNLTIVRNSLDIGRYYMIKHQRDQPNNNQANELLKHAASRMNHDGLSNLEYQLIKVEKTRLYTKLLVKYNQPT